VGYIPTTDLLRNYIMFSVEKLSVLNVITRGAMRQHIPEGNITILNLVDEKSLNKIAESTGARFWYFSKALLHSD